MTGGSEGSPAATETEGWDEGMLVWNATVAWIPPGSRPEVPPLSLRGSDQGELDRVEESDAARPRARQDS